MDARCKLDLLPVRRRVDHGGRDGAGAHLSALAAEDESLIICRIAYRTASQQAVLLAGAAASCKTGHLSPRWSRRPWRRAKVNWSSWPWKDVDGSRTKVSELKRRIFIFAYCGSHVLS